VGADARALEVEDIESMFENPDLPLVVDLGCGWGTAVLGFVDAETRRVEEEVSFIIPDYGRYCFYLYAKTLTIDFSIRYFWLFKNFQLLINVIHSEGEGDDRLTMVCEVQLNLESYIKVKHRIHRLYSVVRCEDNYGFQPDLYVQLIKKAVPF
jgi:hypothetical protein